MAVGKSVRRVDAVAKASGEAKYVSDMILPGMLVGKVLFSKVAYGKILRLDVERARSIDGVFAVVTSKDVPGKNICHIVFDDMPFLAEDEVRFYGQAIAIVAAESETKAIEALKAIELEIEPQNPLIDPEKFADADSPRLFGENNVFAHHKIRRGNTEVGFAECDAVIERTYRTGYQEHAYLETQGMLAVPSSEGGIDVYGTMQCPFYVHGAVADVLGLPQSKVRVVQTTTGGAFGGKEDVPSLIAGWASLLAISSCKPVKLILNRNEDFFSMSKRHPSRTKVKIGASAEGKLIAAEIDIIFDAGAYSTLSPVVLWRGIVHSCGPYRVANAKIDARAVATNKVPCGAYRGFGSPQTLFAIESAIDELAKELGIDEIELRKKNHLHENDATVTGQVLSGSVGLQECFERALEASDYFELKKRLAEETGSIRRGVGVSTIYYGVGLGAGGTHMARTGAYVSVQQDGSVHFAVGTTEMGQGMRTVLGQIVAEAFGIDVDRVYCLPVDSSRVPDSGPTVASRATTMSGRALLTACAEIKGNIAKAIEAKLATKAVNIGFGESKVFRVDEPSRFLSWQEAITEAWRAKAGLTVVGHDSSPPTSWDAETGHGDAYVVFSWAVNVAQVAVDTRTGVVRLEKLWAAHDMGKAINPQLVEGQIEGGSLQGAGYSLIEEYLIDEAGRPLNPRFSFYHIPTTADAPEIVPIIVEAAYKDGPFGAKGFGEQPLMGIAPAVANAVYNAVGVRFREQPFIPERVWTGLKDNYYEDRI